MQHDLFLNPSRRLRNSYPVLVVLQADIAGGDSRLVAPLVPASALRVASERSLPVVRHDSRDFAVMMPLMGYLPLRLLRDRVGSIAQYRDDISRALDWLFFGI